MLMRVRMYSKDAEGSGEGERFLGVGCGVECEMVKASKETYQQWRVNWGWRNGESKRKYVGGSKEEGNWS